MPVGASDPGILSTVKAFNEVEEALLLTGAKAAAEEARDAKAAMESFMLARLGKSRFVCAECCRVDRD